MFVDDEPIVLPSKVKLSTFNAVNVPNEVIFGCAAVCTTPVILLVKSVAFTFVAESVLTETVSEPKFNFASLLMYLQSYHW